jgi:acyloxyacyl hydrolase
MLVLMVQDHPALAIFSLIGNDVCNGHPGTSHMTPPDTFHEYITKSLVALNAKLPKGSFVVLVGLVDGRVLFNNMHARQHPVGKMVVIFEID